MCHTDCHVGWWHGPSPDPFRGPLAEPGRIVVNPPTADAARWVAVGDARHEGTVHACYRDEATGEWHVLVMVWFPGTSVSPRGSSPS